MEVPNREPTQEEVTELWERCRLHYLAPYWLDSPDDTTGNLAFYGETRRELLGSINLNNLFKWAVPKTIVTIMDRFNLSELKALGYLFVLWQEYYNKTSEFTYSLFWAIRKVIKEKP